MRPDADITSRWTVCCSATNAWEALDENVTQAQSSIPAEQFLYAKVLNTVTEVALSTAALNGASPTTSKAWFYGNTSAGETVRADVIWGGSVRGTTTVAGGQEYQWHSIDVTPPDQAAVDDLRIRFTVTTGSANSGNLFATYFELNTDFEPSTAGGGDPRPPQRTLTVTPPTGSGTITGTGIDCPGDCSETYADGTAVTLSATPAAGSTFAGWSGSCSGTGACALSMSSNKSVSGSFTSPAPPQQHTLTVTPLTGSGSGNISGTGINCPGDCSEIYADGTAVTLSAYPPAGSTFAGWSGACSGTGACQLNMDANKSVSGSLNTATTNSSACPLADPSSVIGLKVAGCTTVASDTALDPSPLSFWGQINCQNAGRHQHITGGGDPSLTASGSAQGSAAYRHLSVFDGDDQSGERCELGYNWAAPNPDGDGITRGPGPTVFYREGTRRATFVSLRLPSNFPINSPNWQVVTQMKQTQPYNNPDGSPVIETQVRNGQFIFANNSVDFWTAPATTNVWTRFVYDVTYSQNPSIGSIQVGVDLNGDGTIDSRSPRRYGATLRAETSGPSTFVPVGSSIQNHLRTGIYHNASIPCPAPSACSIDVDNVQVLAP